MCSATRESSITGGSRIGAGSSFSGASATGSLTLPTPWVWVWVWLWDRGEAAIGRASWESGAMIQVSLLPPPWELFTTSEPSRSATRVRPPLVT